MSYDVTISYRGDVLTEVDVDKSSLIKMLRRLELKNPRAKISSVPHEDTKFDEMFWN